MEISLIRHTQVYNPDNLCYGQSNIPLSESFKNDASEIKKKIENKYDIIYSSPSERCTILCKELELDYIKDDRLLEINFGDWELKSWNQIPITQIDNWAKDIINYRPGNGENLQDLNNRVNDFIKDISQSKQQSILIVTHAGVIRCISSHFLQTPLEQIMQIPIHYNEIFKFNYR